MDQGTLKDYTIKLIHNPQIGRLSIQGRNNKYANIVKVLQHFLEVLELPNVLEKDFSTPSGKPKSYEFTMSWLRSQYGVFARKTRILLEHEKLSSKEKEDILLGTALKAIYDSPNCKFDFEQEIQNQMESFTLAVWQDIAEVLRTCCQYLSPQQSSFQIIQRFLEAVGIEEEKEDVLV